jgi:hypothetical protein
VHQTELNTVTSWTTSLWKAYLCPTALNPVPVSVWLEKSSMPFLPSSLFQSYLNKSADLTGEQHEPYAISPLTSQEHNPAQPLGRLNHPEQNWEA